MKQTFNLDNVDNKDKMVLENHSVMGNPKIPLRDKSRLFFS